MQLIAAQILDARRVRRSPEESAEALDGADVAFLRPRRELAHRHIFDHAPAQRTDGCFGHGMLPEVGLNTPILRQDPPIPLLRCWSPRHSLRAALYRESGLVQ